MIHFYGRWNGWFPTEEGRYILVRSRLVLGHLSQRRSGRIRLLFGDAFLLQTEMFKSAQPLLRGSAVSLSLACECSR